MKTLIKWAFRLFLVMIVLIVAGILLMDGAIKSALTARIKERTGMDVKIGRLEVGLWSPRFSVEDVVLYNTAEFGGGPMVDLKELRVEYDRHALFRERKLHFNLIRLDLAEFTVVQNRDGRSNLEDFKEKSDKAKDKNRDKEKGKLEFAGIDTLSLNIRKLKSIDLRQPEGARTVDLHVENEVITGITDQASARDKLTPLVLRAGLPIIYEGLYQTASAVRPKRPRETELTANTTTNAVAPAVNAPVRQ